MEDLVWAFVTNAEHRERMDLLRDIFADKDILSMSSRLWEHWCRRALDGGSSGKGFQIRRLPPDAVGKSAAAAAAVGAKADKALGIVKEGKDAWFLPAPTATSVEFSSLDDLTTKLAVPAGGSARRFVAPPNFPAIDFCESHLKQPCGSNAIVSTVHNLVVQGERLKSGWRAIAESRGLIASGGAAQRPIIHLWLVPRPTLADCKAGPLVIAEERMKPLSGKARAAQVLVNKAVSTAHALEPHIVQYAVLVPPPASS